MADQETMRSTSRNLPAFAGGHSSDEEEEAALVFEIFESRAQPPTRTTPLPIEGAAD